ncbi:MAG TPA: hypothetical protein VHU89_03090 [Acidobacteriaceae bacterium]|jgi:hypothetical protein|nr:hypothetical protein [Acidobacteriaceae bacterium]
MSKMRSLAGAAAAGVLLATLSCARHVRHEPGPRVDPGLAQAIAGIWAVAHWHSCAIADFAP